MKERTFVSSTDNEGVHICNTNNNTDIIISLFLFCIIKFIIINCKCTFALMKGKGTDVMRKANAKSA
jgi:hypothetical protein